MRNRSRWTKGMARFLVLALLVGSMTALSACGAQSAENAENGTDTMVETNAAVGTDTAAETDAAGAATADTLVNADTPLTILDDKYRTYYEIFVYSFYDSDGDGIGDLQGVIEKLDYLNDGDDTTDSDLGINGIWLMPIMPSTTYHKYDTTDYMDIDPVYGTLEDFDALIAACHERGIRVIIDLAMNHSSSEHPWFTTAAEYLRSLPEGAEPDSSECPYVDYYHFSREKLAGYEPLSGSDWYYEAQFWGGMPDLNLTNEAVRAEFEAVADFWLDRGVDGFRLDAVKEYVTGSVADNVEILTWFADYVHGEDPENYIVCECWTDQQTYAQYYASGVDSMFDFAFADKSGIIANVVTGKSKALSYAKNAASEEELYDSYNADYVNAPFYVNHDLGRSAGYYAGENSLAQTKLGNALNLLSAGNAFLYYGEELGMKGSGKDENKRAPMYWSKDQAAEGMCNGPADMEDFQMKYDSLEEQAADATSIYHYVKQAIRIRNQFPAIARGTTSYVESLSGTDTFAMTRKYEDTTLLILGNSSAADTTLSLDAEYAEVSDLTLAAELYTGEEQAVQDGASLTLPAYSIVIYEVEMK